jgi:hypothetical protein
MGTQPFKLRSQAEFHGISAHETVRGESRSFPWFTAVGGIQFIDKNSGGPGCFEHPGKKSLGNEQIPRVGWIRSNR